MKHNNFTYYLKSMYFAHILAYFPKGIEMIKENKMLE